MITRMENVGMVVGDLQGAIEFFARLGLAVEGIAMRQTPDGNGCVELGSPA